MRELSRVMGLPYEIRMAYFHRFNGFSLLNRSLSYTFCPMQDWWRTFDDMLSLHSIPRRLHKECYEWLEQYIPNITPKPIKEPCLKLMSFLNTLYANFPKKQVMTTLFVKTDVYDGVIYALQGRDIKNLQMLSNPVDTLDRFCAHVLTTGNTNFDFTPYFQPLTPLK